MTGQVLSLHLIGWDDVKCRPIYQAHQKRKTPSDDAGKDPLDKMSSPTCRGQLLHIKPSSPEISTKCEVIGTKVFKTHSSKSTKRARCVSLSPATVDDQQCDRISPTDWAEINRKDSKRAKRKGKVNSSTKYDLGVSTERKKSTNYPKRQHKRGRPDQTNKKDCFNFDQKKIEDASEESQMKKMGDMISIDNTCRIQNQSTAALETEIDDNKASSIANLHEKDMHGCIGSQLIKDCIHKQNKRSYSISVRESSRGSKPSTKNIDGKTTAQREARAPVLDASSAATLNENGEMDKPDFVESLSNQFHTWKQNKRSYGTNTRKSFRCSKASSQKTDNPPAADRAAAAPVLVGWDEVKCRPIYQAARNKNPEPLLKALKLSKSFDLRAECSNDSGGNDGASLHGAENCRRDQKELAENKDIRESARIPSFAPMKAMAQCMSSDGLPPISFDDTGKDCAGSSFDLVDEGEESRCIMGEANVKRAPEKKSQTSRATQADFSAGNDDGVNIDSIKTCSASSSNRRMGVSFSLDTLASLAHKKVPKGNIISKIRDSKRQKRKNKLVRQDCPSDATIQSGDKSIEETSIITKVPDKPEVTSSQSEGNDSSSTSTEQITEKLKTCLHEIVSSVSRTYCDSNENDENCDIGDLISCSASPNTTLHKEISASEQLLSSTKCSVENTSDGIAEDPNDCKRIPSQAPHFKSSSPATYIVDEAEKGIKQESPSISSMTSIKQTQKDVAKTECPDKPLLESPYSPCYASLSPFTDSVSRQNRSGGKDRSVDQAEYPCQQQNENSSELAQCCPRILKGSGHEQMGERIIFSPFSHNASEGRGEESPYSLMWNGMDTISLNHDVDDSNLINFENLLDSNKIDNGKSDDGNQEKKRRSYGTNERKPFWIPNFLNQHAPSSAAISNTKVSSLIGWDEEKCRPIYFQQKKKSPTPSEDTVSCDENPIGQHKVDGNESDPVEEKSGDILHNKMKRKPFLKKKRGYGALTKKTGMMLDSIIYNADFVLPNSLMATVPSSLGVIPSHKTLSDGVHHEIIVSREPTNQEGNIEQKQDKENEGTKSLDSAQMQGLISPAGYSSESKIQSTNSEKTNKSVFDIDMSNNTSDMPAMLDIGKTDETNIKCQRQPSSKSSLEYARIYFEQLDSNHHLNVQHNDNNDNKFNIAPTYDFKTNAIRTKRKLSSPESSPKLRVEYLKYCKAMQGEGVDPIAMTEFARNWSLHFSKLGIICDRFFDEE